MAVITTEKLGDSVGAQVHGVDREQLLDDEDLPAWTLDALEANGALVFRDLHLDDEAQVAFSRKLGKVEVFGKGEHPEIFRVTLDPAKNPSAQYLRGTFDWHIDGCTDDIPIMATMLSAHAVRRDRRRDRVRQLVRRLRRCSSDDEKAQLEGVRVVHTIEASQRLFNTNPSDRGGGELAPAPGEGAPAGVAAQLRSPVARARRHHRPRRRHGPGRGPALLDDLLDRGRPRPSGCTATSGRWATS